MDKSIDEKLAEMHKKIGVLTVEAIGLSENLDKVQNEITEREHGLSVVTSLGSRQRHWRLHTFMARFEEIKIEQLTLTQQVRHLLDEQATAKNKESSDGI